ncbi:survival protein sure-like phosphatase/nucleotidase [Geopyxis carbonaria]|nr:survival protein sure-like phosphatase/nucleotidase [Geopyxis carbonaria]
MHILIINDDGPPTQVSSPYVHSFVHELQQAGHTVSVVLPHTQRSWIGKAHLVGKTLTPTYFRPGALHTDEGTTHTRPRTDGGEEWILVDGTPASCAQIGIHHYFKEKGPIDLVVSGPNYGRNSTALFALSSGTIGGAMEAAVCGKRAIALSYAFLNRNHDPVIIKGASLMAVRVVQYLSENWHEDVDLYTINVPLREGVESPDTKVMFTNMLQNYWASGSSFEEIAGDDDMSPEESEAQIREQGEGEEKTDNQMQYGHKKFKWAPRFTDVYESVEHSTPGNDGWTVKEGHVSITPLKANFMHSASDLIGQQIKLPQHNDTIHENQFLIAKTSALRVRDTNANTVWALVRYDDAYVQPKIIAVLRELMPNVEICSSISQIPQPGPNTKILDWSAYEDLDFERIVEHPDSWLSCSYIIRKALIRKHHLALTVRHHVAKYPSSILTRTFPVTCDFELDYAEYLDEALAEAYEVSDSLATNDTLPAEERTWWILKPGMSDRGQGIRLFSTTEELTEIFESFESSDDEDEDEDEDEDKDEGNTSDDGDNGIMTSQLRHFVAQRYIHPPLLVNDRKFHIRTYVLAVGGLRVFVYKPMLALFAAAAYTAPTTDTCSLDGHLTNTCLQTPGTTNSVKLFWDLDLGDISKDDVWKKICSTTADLFEGAARTQRVHFQTLPNAFEIFGVDFVVDAKGGVWVLEVNAYPDFKQTGEELGGVIEGLLRSTVKTAVGGFFGQPLGEAEDMVEVLNIGMGKF